MLESLNQSDKAKEVQPTNANEINFNAQAENQKVAFKEMTSSGSDSKGLLPALQIDFSATASGDKPQPAAVKDAVAAYEKQGPGAALETIREDLAAFEKEQKLILKLPAERGGAGFDLENSTKIAEEKSAERWQAVKSALLEKDPQAMEKLKVAYLDTTLKAMSEAGGRYGSLDQYGIAGKAHFDNQKVNGASPVVRELAAQISSEYTKIADPKGNDIYGNRIDQRELATYKAAQEKTWR